MEGEEIKVGDKVICLYRKDHRAEGRIHLGFGIVTHMSRSGLGPFFYSIELDRRDETIKLINSPPYGAVVPYSKELDDEMSVFHHHHLDVLLAIEDKYFEKLGVKE